jgi:hypothetical protein
MFCDAAANKPIAFASIDGSALLVERDLINACSLLWAGGVIAIDDFLNPLTLGVTEGVMAWLEGRAAANRNWTA